MHVATLHELVADAVTVVVPIGNRLPDVGEYVIVGTGTPVAVAANEILSVHCPLELLTVMSEGHEMVGNSFDVIEAGALVLVQPLLLVYVYV